MALSLAALGMATWSLVEVENLQGRLNDLQNHVNVLDDRITATHETVVRLGELQRDFYHYTTKGFADLTAEWMTSFAAYEQQSLLSLP